MADINLAKFHIGDIVNLKYCFGDIVNLKYGCRTSLRVKSIDTYSVDYLFYLLECKYFSHWYREDVIVLVSRSVQIPELVINTPKRRYVNI